MHCLGWCSINDHPEASTADDYFVPQLEALSERLGLQEWQFWRIKHDGFATKKRWGRPSARWLHRQFSCFKPLLFVEDSNLCLLFFGWVGKHQLSFLFYLFVGLRNFQANHADFLSGGCSWSHPACTWQWHAWCHDSMQLCEQGVFFFKM